MKPPGFDVLWWLNWSIKFLPKQIPVQSNSLTFSITLGSLFSCILIGASTCYFEEIFPMGLITEIPGTHNSIWRWGETTGMSPLHGLSRAFDKYNSKPTMKSCGWEDGWTLKKLSRSTIKILPLGLSADLVGTWHLASCLEPPADDCREMSMKISVWIRRCG